jgi:hypothetical protein
MRFCTYFDSRFLLRGVTLYRSLVRHHDAVKLDVLCLDEQAFEALSRLALPNVQPHALAELEATDIALKSVKSSRSLLEYYFTIGPSWIRWLLTTLPPSECIYYLDADMFCFSDPAPVEEELAGGSVLLIEHRFPEKLERLLRFGKFNVGLLGFRHDEHGSAALDWWTERCLEWCYDRVENGRYADQKYLDDWPTRFKGVVVARHPGAGLGPWNIIRHDLRSNSSMAPLVDGYPVIFFHFHGFRVLTQRVYNPGLRAFSNAPRPVIDQIVQPYFEQLRGTAAWLQKRGVPVSVADRGFRWRGGLFNMMRTLIGLRYA